MSGAFGAGRGGRRGLRAGVAVAAVCLAVGGVHACGEEGTAPEERIPGELAVTLVSPNGDEGAVVLEALGREITGVTMTEGRAFLGGSGLRTRIVALLAEPGEIRVTLEVENVERPPRLSILQVADGSNRLRGDVSGYSLGIGVVGVAGTVTAKREVAP